MVKNLPANAGDARDTGSSPESERSPGVGKSYSPWVSLVVQKVKNLPVMQENRIRSLDQEDPLQKGMATYSSILFFLKGMKWIYFVFFLLLLFVLIYLF